LWHESRLKSQPKLNRHSDECLVKISDQNTQGASRSKSQTESEQNWFSENKTSWLFFPVSSFCDLFMDVPPFPGANTIRSYFCEFFSAQYEPEMKLHKLVRNFTSFGRWYSLGLHKISEKFSRNCFLLKFHVRISTEFGTKRDKFQVKRMSIHQWNTSNSFAHRRTFLSALAVMNKKFISGLVARIWGSNLSQYSIDTVTNV